ncbi:acylneuraminate cytidylyltransferase family protein [Fusibacter ferrireducens]|uniref:Acylneuraminate cytidylyltransferase family protein n=1 Tax=Fusibacter ferrireducens TaxID=2785058 RepID=A0ABR9ZZ12_9FIRM|nr:acylneuraminate cytidylyltransferase family protein [Fusibacter ferrireducens]MBF4695130.1 acylneuraminate cytidylyltransferase family protein [Fusibacter ferrireducens]
MKILFTICGRSGSKGIKNKNLKEFLGFPLPFYTVSIIDLFMKSNEQHGCDIVLNTDSDELIALFKKKLRIPIEIVERAPELGKDNTPKVHVIQNSYLVIKERLKKKYDLIIDLDITSPLRTLKDLETLVEKKFDSDADVVFSVTDSRRNPYFNMVMKTDRGYVRVIKSNFNARQEAPEIYDMNASMYAYSPEFLLSGKGIFEGKCDIIKMMDTAVLDIDHENDFELMEVIAKYLFDKDQNMSIIKNNIDGLIRNN